MSTHVKISDRDISSEPHPAHICIHSAAPLPKYRRLAIYAESNNFFFFSQLKKKNKNLPCGSRNRIEVATVNHTASRAPVLVMALHRKSEPCLC